MCHFRMNIYININEGRTVGVLFLDLKKVFDTVNHAILVSKLSQLGISDDVLLWVESYLYGCLQTTYVNGHYSSVGSIDCWVSQGSILGLLFFILYVNSLPDSLVESRVYLYADDTAIAVSGNSTHRIIETLSSELQIANNWFRDHLLSLNLQKTKVMFFGTSQHLPKVCDVKVALGNVNIECVSQYKYLRGDLIVACRLLHM